MVTNLLWRLSGWVISRLSQHRQFIIPSSPSLTCCWLYSSSPSMLLLLLPFLPTSWGQMQGAFYQDVRRGKRWSFPKRSNACTQLRILHSLPRIVWERYFWKHAKKKIRVRPSFHPSFSSDCSNLSSLPFFHFQFPPEFFPSSSLFPSWEVEEEKEGKEPDPKGPFFSFPSECTAIR